MNVQINKLVKSLLQKDSLEQCSLQELEQFADRNPYFGAAQLLLTKKLQIENHDRYEEQLQKTFLFFHNPMWVEHLLNETGNAQIVAPDIKKVSTPAQVIVEKVSIPDSIVEKSSEPEQVIAEHLEIPVIIAPENKEPEPGIAEQVVFPVVIPEENKEQITIDTFTEKQSEPEVETNVQETVLPVFSEEPATNLPAFKIDNSDSKLPDGSQSREDAAKTELVFEPFYTVDYFASQGIKFKAEDKPTDKFGQQLKSFTEWLKTIKKLPVAEIMKSDYPTPLQTAIVEKKVEQMAENSLAEREVVTEAMAEVWEKQGNVAKAIEVYSKLSLIYPSKSPYFAAKIDDLKKTN